MRILVVHDRAAVAAKIAKRCKSVCKCQIDDADDIVSARKRLNATLYDLLIIDLTLPHRKGGPTDYSQALNLLDDIFCDEIFPPADIIGLTNDKQAYEAIYSNNERESKMMKVVFEEETSNWLDKIEQTIRYVHRSGESRLRALSSTFDVDVLIMCALDEEFVPINSSLELTQVKGFNHVYSFTFMDANLVVRQGIAASIGKQGQEWSTSFTQSLISWYRPQLVLMVGICGGVSTKVKLGDVVIFESVFNWDAGKYSGGDNSGVPPMWLSARPESIGIEGTKIHDSARLLVRDWPANKSKTYSYFTSVNSALSFPFEIFLKVAASGSSVVATGEIIDRIKALHDNIHAVDMESYGLYLAAKRTFVVKPNVLCVKGVSDFCDVAKADDFHERAAWASWSVARQLMTDWSYSS